MSQTMEEYLKSKGTREVDLGEELKVALEAARFAACEARTAQLLSAQRTAYTTHSGQRANPSLRAQAVPRNRVGKIIRKLAALLRDYSERERAAIAFYSEEDIRYITRSLRRKRLT